MSKRAKDMHFCDTLCHTISIALVSTPWQAHGIRHTVVDDMAARMQFILDQSYTLKE